MNDSIYRKIWVGLYQEQIISIKFNHIEYERASYLLTNAWNSISVSTLLHICSSYVGFTEFGHYIHNLGTKTIHIGTFPHFLLTSRTMTTEKDQISSGEKTQ